MDNPNEYEQAVEAYGAAVRRQREAETTFRVAEKEMVQARQDRQDKWRVVSGYVNDKKIVPGVYRLNKGPGMYADAVLIEEHHDYPELFPMFR